MTVGAQLAGVAPSIIRHSHEPDGVAMSRRHSNARCAKIYSSRSAPSPSSALLCVASRVESEVRDEACTSQQNNCDNDVHGYNSSNFAMADSIRVCSE